MNAFDRIIDALRDYGWPGMSDQQAYEVLASQGISPSSLLRPISEYLSIAMREARSGTQQLRIAA